MTGTQKQVQWAEKIKAAYVGKIEAGKETFCEKAGVNQAPEAIKTDILAAYDRLLNWDFETASEWIDSREEVHGAILLASKSSDQGVYKVAAMLSRLNLA